MGGRPGAYTRARSFSSLTAQSSAPLLLEAEHLHPMLDVGNVQTGTLHPNDSRGIADLTLGFPDLRPLELRQQHIFRRRRVEPYTGDVDLPAARKLFLTEGTI